MSGPILVDEPELLANGGWYINNIGYVARDRQVKGVRKRELLHRVIMRAKSSQIVDHINGNKLDNRRINLRFCSKAENAFNSVIDKQLGRSKERGISWDSQLGKWRVRFLCNGKVIYGGSFFTVEEAIPVRNELYFRYHGSFTNLKRKRG